MEQTRETLTTRRITQTTLFLSVITSLRTARICCTHPVIAASLKFENDDSQGISICCLSTATHGSINSVKLSLLSLTIGNSFDKLWEDK